MHCILMVYQNPASTTQLLPRARNGCALFCEPVRDNRSDSMPAGPRLQRICWELPFDAARVHFGGEVLAGSGGYVTCDYVI